MRINIQNLGLIRASNNTNSNFNRKSEGVTPCADKNANTNSLNKFTMGPAYFHPVFGCDPNIARFSKLADKGLKIPESIQHLTDEIRNVIHFSYSNLKYALGHGQDGSVHRINSKYVIKVDLKDPINIDNQDLKICNDNRFDSLRSWCGKVVAKIGNVEVLRNANPHGSTKSAGVPLEITDWEEIKNYYNKVHLKRSCKLPQKAFDEIAEDFVRLNLIQSTEESSEKFYAFDTYNPNNFMLSKEDIKIVDKINRTKIENKNNLASMLEVFLDKYNRDINTSFDKTLIKPRRIIFNKCVLACERSEISLPKENDDVQILKASLRLLKPTTNWDALKSQLLTYRGEISNIEERMSAIEIYLNSMK